MSRQYDDLRHNIDTKMLSASNLVSQQEQQDFVTNTFVDIHKEYQEKHINHEQYLKLINRLAAYKNGRLNDYIDMLAGAALTGMLDLLVEESKRRNVAKLAEEHRQEVTDLTGIKPTRPDDGK